MAVDKFTSLSISSPLVGFGHALFGAGLYSDTSVFDDGLIPFANWNIQADQFSQDTQEAAWFGRRAAAAIAIQTGHLGVETKSSLRTILASPRFQQDLNDRTRPGHAAADHFIRQISRYLWALAQLVSPLQLSSDAEAYISEQMAYQRLEDAEEEASSAA